MGACDLPLMNTVCDAVGGVVSSTGKAVTDGIGAWIAKSMGEVAQSAADLASKAVDRAGPSTDHAPTRAGTAHSPYFSTPTACGNDSLHGGPGQRASGRETPAVHRPQSGHQGRGV
ncbi:hypothetical protein [Streptomyces lydicus]